MEIYKEIARLRWMFVSDPPILLSPFLPFIYHFLYKPFSLRHSSFFSVSVYLSPSLIFLLSVRVPVYLYLCLSIDLLTQPIFPSPFLYLSSLFGCLSTPVSVSVFTHTFSS